MQALQHLSGADNMHTEKPYPKSRTFVCSCRDIFMTWAIIVRFLIYPPGSAERMVSHPITAAHCRGKSKLVP